MTDWGGAQWVLLTWVFMMNLMVPAVLRAGGVTGKDGQRASATKWAGFYLSKVISATALITVLWWGGFFS